MGGSAITYSCSECGESHAKWSGSCSACGAWNSLQEQSESRITHKITKTDTRARTTVRLGDKADNSVVRIPVGIKEFDRVLGGGLVPGTLVLLGGDPGIGKSTLILQSTAQLATINTVLYASGEESSDQILLRAERLKLKSENAHIISETNIETILATAKKLKPIALIIDSIQTISSDQIPGTSGAVSQVRYCTELLLNFANETGIATIIIGHVTKEGALAGPRTLEHLVDTVLYLEGDRYEEFRILRGVKNRFGSTGEIGIFQMESEGLIELKDSHESFISDRNTEAFGTAQTVVMEGSRPFVVEVQALTNETKFGNPRRNASGFDQNRLQLLIAILAKHTAVKLHDQDVYINVVGGMKISERSADLAVLAALASSFYQKPLPTNQVFLAEVGLTGELRPAASLDRRLAEATSLKIDTVFTAKYKKSPTAKKMHIEQIVYIHELITSLFKKKK